MSSRAGALLLALLAIPWWGCKGNIDENHPTIAVTDLLSRDASGLPGDLPSLGPAITPDGRYVAFSSRSSNLAGVPTGGIEQIFVRDRVAGTTRLVSYIPAGSPGNGDSTKPSISDNGRYVAFQSKADDLLGPGGDTNSLSDIFVADLGPPGGPVGATIRVSVITGAGAESTLSGPGTGSTGACISGDGAFVAFESDCIDLALTPPDYPFFCTNVFRHPRAATGTVDVVSFTSSGFAAASANSPSISQDGSMIAFVSSDTDMILAGTNGSQHAYLWISGGTTELISVDSAEVEAVGNSNRPMVSPDGTFVIFESDATNLAADTNGAVIDIFVRDRSGGGTTTLVSRNDAGVQGGGNSQFGALSANGRFVAFVSAATNLVTGDGNGRVDVFWRDLQLGITRRVSVRTYGAEANGDSSTASRPLLTADGRFVVFDSAAFNLVLSDGNGVDDIFIHGPVY